MTRHGATVADKVRCTGNDRKWPALALRAGCHMADERDELAVRIKSRIAFNDRSSM